MAQSQEQEQQQPILSGAGYRQLYLPEPYGDGDVETWLRLFNLCTEANRWAADDKLFRFTTLLRGRAFAVYERLEDDQKDTYAYLVAALTATFEPRTEERHRLPTFHLTNRILQPGESLDVFLRDLERLLDRAQPGLAREVRRQQLIDRFIA